MKKRQMAAALFLILLLGGTAVQADDGTKFSPKSVGFSLVGTRVDATQMHSSGMGLGGHVALDFNLTRSLTLTAGGGILTATDGVFSMDERSIILLPSIDLSLKYNWMPDKLLQPYFFAGYGVCNEADKTNIAGGGSITNTAFRSYLMAGTGFEVNLNAKQNKFFMSGEFRNSVFSSADPKPTYWVVKTGLSLNLDNPIRLAEMNDEKNQIAELFAKEESNSANESSLTLRMLDLVDDIFENTQRINEMKEIVHAHDRQFAALSNPEETYQESFSAPAQSASYFPPEPAVPYMTRYRQALDSYYEEDYPAARQIFQELSVADPNHKFASNCKYWLGECYHSLGEIEKAIAEFDSVLDFTVSHKLDDSLLMKGQCYLLINQKESAFSVFRELLRRFPNSEYRTRARNYLNAG